MTVSVHEPTPIRTVLDERSVNLHACAICSRAQHIVGIDTAVRAAVFGHERDQTTPSETAVALLRDASGRRSGDTWARFTVVPTEQGYQAILESRSPEPDPS